MASTRHPALVGLRTETRMPRKQVIAVVDDDECAREGTIDLVKSMGFVAKAFERAEDFLKSDYLHSSSCLIADVRMPGMTGLELLDRLVESGSMTPTILMTSFPNEWDRAPARHPGHLLPVQPIHSPRFRR